jgi:DNA-binding LytR/AlgR family response regulator
MSEPTIILNLKSEIKTMTLSCIAVDDEPFALEILADDIKNIPFLSLKGAYSNAFDAEERLKNEDIDLMFLDIQMPTLRGNDFLRSLKNPPMVIFTTAYEQYALEGFELNVLDYLLKPIPFERFKQSVQKAFDVHQLHQKTVEKERSFFFVFSEYNKIKLYHDEILYIEGMKDYVKIYTKTNDKALLTRLNLKNIETKLPEKGFCRVHQSFIVALDKITSFQKNKLLIHKQEIPIGERFLEGFEKAIK